jgi:hypothetical protein
MYTAINLADNAMKLTKEEQAKLFEILSDNAELFDKLIPNMPLLTHMLIGGNLDINHRIADAYSTWKRQQE